MGSSPSLTIPFDPVKGNNFSKQVFSLMCLSADCYCGYSPLATRKKLNGHKKCSLTCIPLSLYQTVLQEMDSVGNKIMQVAMRSEGEVR